MKRLLLLSIANLVFFTSLAHGFSDDQQHTICQWESGPKHNVLNVKSKGAENITATLISTLDGVPRVEIDSRKLKLNFVNYNNSPAAEYSNKPSEKYFNLAISTRSAGKDTFVSTLMAKDDDGNLIFNQPMNSTESDGPASKPLLVECSKTQKDSSKIKTLLKMFILHPVW